MEGPEHFDSTAERFPNPEATTVEYAHQLAKAMEHRFNSPDFDRKDAEYLLGMLEQLKIDLQAVVGKRLSDVPWEEIEAVAGEQN